jgi:hypothetical protein
MSLTRHSIALPPAPATLIDQDISDDVLTEVIAETDLSSPAPVFSSPLPFQEVPETSGPL